MENANQNSNVILSKPLDISYVLGRMKRLKEVVGNVITHHIYMWTRSILLNVIVENKNGNHRLPFGPISNVDLEATTRTGASYAL